MTKSTKSNRRLTAIVTFIAGGIFLLGAAIIPLLVNAQEKALESAAPIIPPVTSNYLAPQLALTNLDGTPSSLEDYRGQVILVNNWATWCPPCKTEMPELQAYYSAHSADGFVVVAIESGEPADEVVAFVNDYGLSFPVWLDLHDVALEAFQNWNLPSSYIIDRGGMVRLSWTGAIDRQTLEQYVTPLLEVKK